MPWPVLTTYEKDKLREIAFPIGGIGTGTVSLGGRGNLRDWEIMNRPSKGFAPEFGFFALWTKKGMGKPDTRLLEGVIPFPYTGSSGVPGVTSGIPRFRRAVFHAAYPLGSVELSDPSVPLAVTLEAFNPLVPLDPEKSGLPIAMFRFTLANSNAEPVEASISASFQNFIGNDGAERFKPAYKNEFRRGNGFSGLFYSAEIKEGAIPQNGTIALVIDGDKVSYNRHWARSSWRNDLLEFWDDFSEDGVLADHEADGERTYTGSLASSLTVPAKGKRTVTFLLAWHFPNRTARGCGWQLQPGEKEGPVGNYYATLFKDAWDVTEKVMPELPGLERETAAFVKSFSESTLPHAVKEASLNNISTLRTQNCFRTSDGHFFGFEGVGDKSGCCHGSCTHVWNYETTTAFLFPQLARSMREVELVYSTNESGLNSFRTALPLKMLCTESKPYGAATDGQMGVIMKCYREWQMSGDREFLKTMWPNAKKALAFAWIEGGWDGDRDGVMEGVQHNTYDVEFYGPNPMLTGWYLGALRCGEEMAKAMDDREFADTCRALFEKGSRWVDQNLFNGEFYIQKVQPPIDKDKIPKGLLVGMGSKDMENPDFQVGPGCLVDQMIGQYMAHITGVGYIADRKNIRKSMESVFKYNFRENFYSHFNVLRTYVINDESGLLMCSWPKGGRPKVPFPYFSEAWTGEEYMAAALMIYEGLLKEGLKVVESTRVRFDGQRRNPWNEPECGHHYARAMSAWSVLVALTGFRYSAVEKAITFAPRVGENDFRSFWSAGAGWGTFTQKKTAGSLTAKIALTQGNMELGTIILGPGNQSMKQATVKLDGKTVPATFKISEEAAVITLKNPVTMAKGSVVEVVIA
jgi:non-lysosomal glucosylceramidase